MGLGLGPGLDTGLDPGGSGLLAGPVLAADLTYRIKVKERKGRVRVGLVHEPYFGGGQPGGLMKIFLWCRLEQSGLLA